MSEFEFQTACSQVHKKIFNCRKSVFVDSQLNYAPLIWMLCQKTLDLIIKKIHLKTPRIIHQSNTSYRDLLECNGSTSIYQRHLQFLLLEIYKSIVTTNPGFLRHFFRERKVPYNFRKNAVLFLLSAGSTTHGTNTVQAH